jgi:type IV fimbrial biogenesis protein FimT
MVAVNTRAANRFRHAGFTLLELLVAMGLVGILTAIGIPALRNFTLQQRIGTTVQDLQLDFALARSEAITRATSVSVCTSSDNATCTNTGWEGGRIIFTDANQNGTLDGGDALLRVGYAPLAAMTVTAVPANTFVSFNRLGQANAAVTFTICKSGLKSRVLDVRSSGNPSVSNPNVTC